MCCCQQFIHFSINTHSFICHFVRSKNYFILWIKKKKFLPNETLCAVLPMKSSKILNSDDTRRRHVIAFSATINTWTRKCKTLKRDTNYLVEYKEAKWKKKKKIRNGKGASFKFTYCTFYIKLQITNPTWSPEKQNIFFLKIFSTFSIAFRTF